MATLIKSQRIQTYTSSSYLNTVTINVLTHMPSGNINNTITFKINLYAQWLSEYGHNRDTYSTPSGNINTVSRSINPHAQRPVAISIHVPSGNINIVLEIYTNLNTAEIEKHIHTPSGRFNTVPINLTYLLCDNLNTCAINK